MEAKSKARWAYLIVGTVMFLFIGLLYAWSIFRAPLSELYASWTTMELSMVFTISMTFFCLGGFFSGMIIKRASGRVVLIVAAALLFIGFFLVSRLSESPQTGYIQMCVFYGVISGTGVGMAYNAVLSIIARWFPDKPGMASGILMMGFGFGGMILGSVVSYMIGQSGVFKTFELLAIIIAAVMIVGMLILREKKLPAAGAGSAQAAAPASVKPKDMLKSATFWLLFVWLVISNSAGLLVINSAATIAVAFGAPAVLGLLVSVMNGGGRVLFGTLLDKWGRKRGMTTNSIALVIAGAVLVFGALTQSAVVVLVGMLLTGLSYGGGPPTTSTVILKLFGPEHYSINFSIGLTTLIPAAFIGPLVSGALQESSGGGFQSTFIMVAVLGIILLVANFLLQRNADRAGH